MLIVSMIYEIWVQQALDLSEPIRPLRALRIADRSTSAARALLEGFRERQWRSAYRPERKTYSSTVKIRTRQGWGAMSGRTVWPVGIETPLIVTTDPRIWCQNTVTLADFAVKCHHDFRFLRELLRPP